MKVFTLFIFSLVIFMMCLHNALNMPDVIFSYSTKQCIKVINADGSKGSCNFLPAKYNHIWGK